MLKELFEKYINISKDIITVINENREEECEELIKKRQKIVKDIIDLNCDKAEILFLQKEFDIVSLDNKVKDLIIQRRNEIKEEMISLKKQKQANSAYGRQFENVYFVNKKA